MCRFVESICLENGILLNIEYHNKRFNNTLKEVFNLKTGIKLENLIIIPENSKNGIYKVRVIYSKDVEEIEIKPYEYRKRETLKVVFCNDIDYRYKYERREKLEELFSLRGDCDDILIVKDSRPTDTYASNIVFWDGEKCFTPKFPLLKGTKRQFLLDRGIIEEKDIILKELKKFKGFRLINAMLKWEESFLPITNIKGI